MPDSPAYRGRFAPSPTGPLHLGSLIAALASYLDARHAGGTWLVRMEDLDPPREERGAARQILNSLEAHGLASDEPVLWQSRRLSDYDTALERLRQSGHLFDCDCSRSRLGPGGACRNRCLPRQSEVAVPAARRISVPQDCQVEFKDLWQGQQSRQLGAELPDFVLRRKDGLHAYQLAVVVDDAEQGITHVLRGSDLLDSTPRQIFLQRTLGCATPVYGHFPVITNSEGQKLSKQNHAPALQDTDAPNNLRKALTFLRQVSPPRELTDCQRILMFAQSNWSPGNIPGLLGITAHTLT